MNSKQLAASWKRADMKKLRDELSERQLRERCLHMAIQGSASIWAAGDIVAAAEKFLAFVTRAKRKK